MTAGVWTHTHSCSRCEKTTTHGQIMGNKMDNGATQTSSNADDRAVERGPAEGTPRYWLRYWLGLQKRKHNPSSERQPRGKRARKSDHHKDDSVDKSKMECSDPLLLPDVVVDHILEFVDDDTLLTGRLVCRRWNREISSRNELWRRRCERSGVDMKDETFTSCDDFFTVFLNFRSVLRQMSAGVSWQLDPDCDGSHCNLHNGKGIIIVGGHQRRNHLLDWVFDIVPVFKYKEHLGKKLVVCTEDGELVVLDMEHREVTWRTGTLVTGLVRLFEGCIFTITSLGTVEAYSLDGSVCRVTKTGWKPEDVEAVCVHPVAPFLLVWLASDEVFLVNDEMQVFPLHLPSPQLPQQEESVEFPDAEEGIEDLAFELLVELSYEQLAVVVQRRSTMCFVLFTPSGDVLHHIFVKCSHLIAWPGELVEDRYYRCVCLSEGHVVEYSVQFGSSRVTVEEAWRKALPARFADWPSGVMTAGRQFLIAGESTTLHVFRMNDGALIADFPFFNSHKLKFHYAPKNGFCRGYDTHWTTPNREAQAGERIEIIFLFETRWLDGLSPSTMLENQPLAVSHVCSAMTAKKANCLRWVDGLWADFDLPQEDGDDVASD
ncbi:hypothetical protein ACOMHN_020783 [Nucella lapillus]